MDLFELKFPLDIPQDIIFSPYSFKGLPKHILRLGKKPLIITGRKAFSVSFWGKEILRLLKEHGIEYELFSGVKPEPSIKFVEEGIRIGKGRGCDVVVGIGGGSVMDVAKAVAGLFNEKFDSPADYLYGKEIEREGLPFIAMPTTSGSGSEVTKNAVLKDEAKAVKTSIRDRKLMAAIAIIDPALTLTCPKDVTVYSGLDALTHAIESLVSTGANSFTQGLSLKAIELILLNLPKCVRDLKNLKFRENLSFASFIAGISFSHAGLGLAHALSHPIGYEFNLPHGLVNAILLPYVVEFNFKVAEGGYRRIMELAPCRGRVDLVKYLKDFNRKLGIPSKFSELGLKLNGGTLNKIIERLKYSGSIKYNPIRPDEEELRELVERVW